MQEWRSWQAGSAAGVWEGGAWASFVRPHSGSVGGDVVGVTARADGAVFVVVGDAAGHGPRGAACWSACGEVLARGWAAWVADATDLRGLCFELNDALVAGGHGACGALGCWSAEGTLRFATCGFGAHLVPLGGAPWRPEASARFGLKLGWVPSAELGRLPRGWVEHVCEGVERVVGFTDGVLEDDHRDPVGALASVDALAARLAVGSPQEALAQIEAAAHGEDDVCGVVLTR